MLAPSNLDRGFQGPGILISHGARVVLPLIASWTRRWLQGTGIGGTP
jgi:hypothetical protein